MSYLYFEDDELDILYQAINNQQICFHPTYAPEGKFTVKVSFELQSGDKDIAVIADKNLVSPICEIAKNGTLSDKHRLQKSCSLRYMDKISKCQIDLRNRFIGE